MYLLNVKFKASIILLYFKIICHFMWTLKEEQRLLVLSLIECARLKKEKTNKSFIYFPGLEFY